MWLAWLFTLLFLPDKPSTWLVFVASLPLAALTSWVAARRAGDTWMPFVAATADWHALGLALLYGMAVLLEDTHGITTDGAIYFSHLRSLVFDRDLDIAAEFGALRQPPRPHYLVPVGPTPLWLPLYLAVAAGDAIGRGLGLLAPVDHATVGLGLPYVRAVLVSSYLTGAAGLMAVHARLRGEFTRGVSLASSLLLFGATSLFWYMVYEPSMTHAASFGLVALFVVRADRWLAASFTRRQAMILGTLFGLAVLARPQDALFAILPAVLIFYRRSPFSDRLARAARLAGWALVGALPWLLLQAAFGYALLSRYRFQLAGEGGYLSLLDSRWVDVLFSSWHGFLSWTPIAYLAVLGTIAYWRRDRRWALATLGILAAMAWVNGATEDWAGGWSFGGRRFTSVLAMLGPGLALLIDAMRRRPLLATAPLVAAALIWNHLLMVQYTIGLVPKDEPVSFAHVIRQQGDVQTRGGYFYPFAFPANAWFAWREGLPIDRYDLLAPEPRRSALDLVMDRRADRFLLEGWDAPGADDWGPVWWIAGRTATLAVPLDLPRDRDIAVTLRSRSRFEEPAFETELDVAINDRVIGRMKAPASSPAEMKTSGSSPAEARFVVPAAAFRDVWRAGYNRVTFISRGVQRVDASDTRPPGPIGSRPGNPAWPVAIYRLRIEPAQ